MMEKQLQAHDWLAADAFTIADIAAFPWVLFHDIWGELGPA
jgi:glutathione S-transferase